MAYTKQTWADLPSKTTPINAERLTHIEDGIFNAAQTADTAASTAGTAAANVGIVASKVSTLEGQMLSVQNDLDNKVNKVAGKGLSANDYTNEDKAKVDALGTASTKNSTSVVTQSTDLVESGAVKDALEDIYANIGILTTPVPAVVANSLPVLKRNITSDFYNGSLRGEIAAGNFKNVRAGDYIIGQSTGTTYYVACCDWMFNKGDQTNATYQAQAYGQHHLGLMLFKPVGTTSLWLGKGDVGGSWQVSANDKGRCPWNANTDVDPTSTSAVGANNTNITRSYNGTNMSAYMGSFIRERIDAILLPQCFQADFGSANVLKFRNWNSNSIIAEKVSGGNTNWTGISGGATWVDRFLDLPSEVEVYGTRIFSSSAYDVGVQCERLPMFKNADINAFYPRTDIWTKAVASSSHACHRGSGGHAGSTSASLALWACPLACVR